MDKAPNRPLPTSPFGDDDALAAGFTCRQCGGLAAWVTLVRAGAPEPVSLAHHGPLGIDTARIGVEAGPLSCRFGGQSVDQAARAVSAALADADPRALHDVNEEYAPFWCPVCAASYCGPHWTTWPIWDPELEGFLDEVRGRCPEGHERTILD